MTEQRPSWAIGPIRTADDRTRTPKPPPRLDQIRTAAAPAQFHAAPSDDNVAGVPDAIGLLVGYGACFDQWTEVAQRGGNFMEKISRSAFTGIDAKSVIIMYSHGSDAWLGSRPLGPIIDLRSDDYGLRYACALLPTQAALELLPGLQAGLFGSSFRFSVTDEIYDPKPQRSADNPDGLPTRVVTGAIVYEMGPTPMPQYRGATAGATPAAKLDSGSSLTLSSNSTASVAASREPRSTPPPSWSLSSRPAPRTDGYLTKCP